ncbi:SoxR reducing system RseC family protein [Natranaerobius trueperi]|uniref:Fis family transcriptional regulator n=1 Tax=Natranaerobius trueperi TaxID=759412 RepID=A0A226BX49_9FIRM|nr:SoxR reducing system RseC family protein [Natranaerobius trueperi]OWZ83593.1 hypothetical protein CDO51_07735 [Natranaerobius trueperi]
MSQSEGQIGEVIQEKDGYVTVKVQRHSACKKCGACDFGLSKNKASTFELKNSINAKIGDKVMIDLEGKDIVQASILIYMVPLLALVTGIIFGSNFFSDLDINEDILGFISGIILMSFAFVGIRIYDKKLQNYDSTKFTPQLKKIITDVVSDDENDKQLL